MSALDEYLRPQEQRDLTKEIDHYRALLRRFLKVADSDLWRCQAGLSLKAHPLVDDVRAKLSN